MLGLASASDVLAPLRVPSLSFWAVLFGIYVILAGPLLFLVLRRYHLEPAAWIVLPILSVVVTVWIYSFGATQRPTGMLTEGVGVLDLVGNGTAEAYGVRAFMSPTVADAMVVTPQPMLALPLQSPTADSATIAEQSGAGTRVSFADVPRWGMRYAYLVGDVNKQGKVTAVLTSVNPTGALSGIVENNTPYHLHGVALFWDGHMYALGDLAPGASIKLGSRHITKSATDNWLSAYSGYNRDIARGIGRSLVALSANANMFNSDIGTGNAMLVGTTTTVTPGLGHLSTSEAIATKQALSLVREFVSVQVQSPLGSGVAP